MLSVGAIEQYNVYLIRIKAVVKYVVNKSIMAKDIYGMESVKNKTIKRALTREELYLIEKATLDPLERCILSVLLYTGLRRNEALALNVEDIYLSKGMINVSKTLIASKNVANCLQEYTKTTSGTRKVPIPRPLIPIF
ncbi:tyrosine-type recombinase/integrase [Lacrimispora sp.]|uniref:tyrosine-type recombinase/integrase n=1 Tax=Lacrimispora sp. TaxID=2719234 RepID=UPI0028AB6983|nr:tyrosine-type recombinase/integrase [Lacrimispora sp.]